MTREYTEKLSRVTQETQIKLSTMQLEMHTKIGDTQRESHLKIANALSEHKRREDELSQAMERQRSEKELAIRQVLMEKISMSSTLTISQSTTRNKKMLSLT